MSMSFVRKVLFPLVLLFAALPCVAVSCDGKQDAKITAYDLALGPEVEEPQLFGPAKKRRNDSEPLAVAALAAAAVGAVVSLGSSRLSFRLGAAAGGVGLALLWWMKSKLDADAVREGKGVLRVEWESGGIAMLCALAAAMLVCLAAQAREDEKGAPRGPDSA